MNRKQLTLVLPCYRPEPGWSEKVVLYYADVKHNLADTDLFLIIVDDGSPGGLLDGEISRINDAVNFFSCYSNEKNNGKGYALRHGVEKAITSSVIYTDIDFPYSVKSLCEVAGLLETNDVVIGIKNRNYYKNVPAYRRVISKALKRMISFFFPFVVTADTQCGLKGISGKGKDVFLQTKTNGYLFDLEFILKASRNQSLRLIATEVELRSNVKFGRVPLTTVLREGLSFLKIVFKFNRI